jgi:hypothetical protein
VLAGKLTFTKSERLICLAFEILFEDPYRFKNFLTALGSQEKTIFSTPPTKERTVLLIIFMARPGPCSSWFIALTSF